MEDKGAAVYLRSPGFHLPAPLLLLIFIHLPRAPRGAPGGGGAAAAPPSIYTPSPLFGSPSPRQLSVPWPSPATRRGQSLPPVSRMRARTRRPQRGPPRQHSISALMCPPPPAEPMSEARGSWCSQWLVGSQRGFPPLFPRDWVDQENPARCCPGLPLRPGPAHLQSPSAERCGWRVSVRGTSWHAESGPGDGGRKVAAVTALHSRLPEPLSSLTDTYPGDKTRTPLPF